MYQNEFSFQEFGFGSRIIQDLVAEKEVIKPFIYDFFSLDALAKQARRRNLDHARREVLVERLNAQNSGVGVTALTRSNIEALSNPKTVTITTGHQLNLMAGPLYTIYKIAQVISLAQAMNRRDDEYQYVPVFWMATEDHDFEEINHIHLFGSQLTWEKEGQENRIVGAVETRHISSFLDQIHEKYQDPEALAKLKELTVFYEQEKDLAQATRQIINALFGSYGLVIIDGNDRELKKAFAPIAQKEVSEAFVYQQVSTYNAQLDKAGYHNQVFVRNCNLFYIDSNSTRQRIAKEADAFFIGDKEISAEVLHEKINESPASFSPNALLRPVYQELILPNVAYIGGGGEIAYWLQIKGVFDAINLPFPLLRVRDSLILLKEKEIEELAQLALNIPELKKDLQDIIKEIALQNKVVELVDEMAALNQIKEKVLQKGDDIDKGLNGLIEAEFAKMSSSFERIESRLIKSEKAKYDQKAKKIAKMQAKIYPNGGFQERYENFLPYFLTNPAFISKIVDTLKATDHPQIKVVTV